MGAPQIIGTFVEMGTRSARFRISRRAPGAAAARRTYATLTPRPGQAGDIDTSRPSKDAKDTGKNDRPKEKHQTRTTTSTEGTKVTHLELPVYSYKSCKPEPVVVYIRDQRTADKSIGKLKGPLGLDIEWKPNFARGKPEHRTALVQIADETRILLIHVCAMKKFPQKVKECLESPDITKVGVGIKDDCKKLRRDFSVAAQATLDLGTFARTHDPSFAEARPSDAIGLRKLVEVYTGKRLVKGKAQRSNWEKELNEGQREYAANDAHAALSVYKRIVVIAEATEAATINHPT